ncbi:Isochorismatase-like protein, partial [Thelonectria olida]
LEAGGAFANAPSDPYYPHFAIPKSLTPKDGWGSRDEIVLGKLQPNCFSSSDLTSYLRARGIKHVVLVGLTTIGSILGSVRASTNLNYHIICVEDGIINDEPEVYNFLMKQVLPKFVDVMKSDQILALGE